MRSGSAAGADDPRRTSRGETPMMNISQAPSGIHVVVETDASVYIGRFGNMQGSKVRLFDAAVLKLAAGQDAEDYIRKTARYGVAVAHRDLSFDATGIRRVRKLGEIPKA